MITSKERDCRRGWDVPSHPFIRAHTVRKDGRWSVSLRSRRGDPSGGYHRRMTGSAGVGRTGTGSPPG
ncbi:MAG: hypothetical protein WB502_04200 [Thermoactinomyces sp.]